MKKAALAMTIGGVIPLLTNAAVNNPLLASPLSALSAYFGECKGEGQMLNTPCSKAARVGGMTDCNGSLNHDYLICDQKVQRPAGSSNGLTTQAANTSRCESLMN
jgi:hypothetical protein